jgi:hypothetical protein
VEFLATQATLKSSCVTMIMTDMGITQTRLLNVPNKDSASYNVQNYQLYKIVKKRGDMAKTRRLEKEIRPPILAKRYYIIFFIVLIQDNVPCRLLSLPAGALPT